MRRTEPSPVMVALAYVGRTSRSLKMVERQQRELRRRRADLLVQLDEARRDLDAVRAEQKAAE